MTATMMALTGALGEGGSGGDDAPAPSAITRFGSPPPRVCVAARHSFAGQDIWKHTIDAGETTIAPVRWAATAFGPIITGMKSLAGENATAAAPVTVLDVLVAFSFVFVGVTIIVHVVNVARHILHKDHGTPRDVVVALRESMGRRVESPSATSATRCRCCVCVCARVTPPRPFVSFLPGCAVQCAWRRWCCCRASAGCGCTRPPATPPSRPTPTFST